MDGSSRSGVEQPQPKQANKQKHTMTKRTRHGPVVWRLALLDNNQCGVGYGSAAYIARQCSINHRRPRDRQNPAQLRHARGMQKSKGTRRTWLTRGPRSCLVPLFPQNARVLALGAADGAC